MAVTIKDVAALAGVSPSTVSRVCNDNPSISKETRDRVRKAMLELGYEQAIPAEEPITPTFRMIGVVLPPSPRETFENSFYLETIRGIGQVCNPKHVICTTITGRDDAEILRSIQTLHQTGQADGFIMLYSKKDDPVVEYLCEHGILYVIIGKANALASQTICIDNDNLLAGQEAAEHLYQIGHRRIGYVGSGGSFLYSADRKAGYQLALLQHELPVRQDYVVEMESLRSDSPSALEQLLSQPDRPTAFVVSDDLLAVGLERMCVQKGLRIPEDISIVSFNNSLLAQLASPQLTSVDVNSFQLGYEAAAQILNHADNPNLMATKIVVPHRIVSRESCQQPKGQ